MRGVLLGLRREHRQPYVVVLLELHLDAQPDVHRFGFRVDDVREEADARILVERDDRHDVRRREIREPLLEVDGEADHRGSARHLRRLELAVAVRAHDHGWVPEPSTRGAPLDAEPAVAATGPEVLGLGQHVGQRSHRVPPSSPECLGCCRENVALLGC